MSEAQTSQHPVTPATRTINCSAVLFDLDGVLIDSTLCVERHWRQWAALHDLDADTHPAGRAWRAQR